MNDLMVRGMPFNFRTLISHTIFYYKKDLDATYYIKRSNPSVLWKRKWCGSVIIESYLAAEEIKEVEQYFSRFKSEREATNPPVQAGGGAGPSHTSQSPTGPQYYGDAA